MTELVFLSFCLKNYQTAMSQWGTKVALKYNFISSLVNMYLNLIRMYRHPNFYTIIIIILNTYLKRFLIG